MKKGKKMEEIQLQSIEGGKLAQSYWHTETLEIKMDVTEYIRETMTSQTLGKGKHKALCLTK